MLLYKFRSLRDEAGDSAQYRKGILEIVNENLLRCSRWVDFEDKDEGAYLSLGHIPLEGIATLGSLSGSDRAKKIKEMNWIARACNDRLRVCSLSQGPVCNEYMWREYGDNHRGVAIEFEVLDAKLRSPLCQVDYESDEKESCRYRTVFEVLNSVGGDIDRLSEALLRWKGRAFSSEREVRLICRQDELTAWKYPDGCDSDLDRACYRLDVRERGGNDLYDFRKLLKVTRVWCGRSIARDDRAFLESNIRRVEISSEPSCASVCAGINDVD